MNQLMRMQTRCFFLLAACWLGLSGAATLAQDAVYVRYTNSWRYTESGDQGTAWRASGFNDLAWPEGQGLFYAEVTPYPQPFLTPLTAPDAGGPITTYYRTRFNYSGSTSGVRFTVTNYVDDGMVAYLNGVEVYRFNMPAGTVGFTTVASAANPLGEGVAFVTNFLASGLINGQNVLAVEVHQSAANSSDVVFGLSMGTVALPAITSQPQSQTNVNGSASVFCVGATGGNLSYQWQSNNLGGWFNIVSGATFPCYTNGTTPPSSAGQYRAIVCNAAGCVTSQVATLTVASDYFGPILQEALVSELQSTNQITITFSEKLLPSTVNISLATTNNFAVYARSGGTTNRVTVENVFYNGITRDVPHSFAVVRVGGPFWDIGSNAYNGNISYYVVVNEVRDERTNVIAPNSVIGVGFPNNFFTNVVQYSSVWNYHPDWAFDPTIYAQPWNSNTYNASANPSWAAVPGLVVKDINPPAPYCVPTATQGFEASYQDTPTLFRYEFFWPTNRGSNVTLRLGYIYDDGVVAYMNGNQILRVNVPGTGPVDETTKSTSELAAPLCGSNVIANVTLLPGRTNVLAAAVVQSAGGLGTPNDITFGMYMDVVSTTVRVGSTPTNTIVPSIFTAGLKVAPNKIKIAWPTNTYNYTVQYTTNVLSTNLAGVGRTNILGPWYQMQPGISNGMVTNFSQQKLPYYIRLQRVP